MQHNFNINTTEVVALTNKLEKLTRSAMPLAVRGTLNDAAKKMKKYKIIPYFSNVFTIRRKNFIKSHTAYNRCKNTFVINEMVSVVGIIKDKSTAGNELINQEYGGRIRSRDYISTDEARVAKSRRRTVKKANKIVDENRKIHKGKNYIKKVYKAGTGGLILHKKWIFRINTITKTKGSLKINTTPIYTFKKGRSVRIKKRPFMAPAAHAIVQIMPRLYKKEAKKRFEKYYK